VVAVANFFDVMRCARSKRLWKNDASESAIISNRCIEAASADTRHFNSRHNNVISPLAPVPPLAERIMP